MNIKDFLSWRGDKDKKQIVKIPLHVHPPFSLGGGKVFGLSGQDHEKEWRRHGFNLFLNLWSAPGVMTASGITIPGSPALVLMPVEDRRAPANEADVDWVLAQMVGTLKKCRTVAVSCQGGHGRTGTILALLLGHFGEKDPIGKLRKIYCTRAVESREQCSYIAKRLHLPEEYVNKMAPKPSMWEGKTAFPYVNFDGKCDACGRIMADRASILEADGTKLVFCASCWSTGAAVKVQKGERPIWGVQIVASMEKQIKGSQSK